MFVLVSVERNSRFCHLYAASYGQTEGNFAQNKETPSGSYKPVIVLPYLWVKPNFERKKKCGEVLSLDWTLP